MFALLAREMTVAEAARRHGASAESINRFVDAAPVPVEVACETARTASVGALEMADCLATTRRWQRGRPRSGARERSVIALGIRRQGARGEARP